MIREERRTADTVWLIAVGPADHERVLRRQIAARAGWINLGPRVAWSSHVFNDGQRVEVRVGYLSVKGA